MLTEDLLALPEQFARSRVETDLRFRELAEAQRRTDERLADLIQVVHGLSIDVGELKGDLLEMRYHTHAAAYLGRLFRRVRPLSTTELADLLDDAVEQNKLADAERDEILLADVVARGKHRETGAEVYVVVEVSWGVGPYDVERAVERARLLSKLASCSARRRRENNDQASCLFSRSKTRPTPY